MSLKIRYKIMKSGVVDEQGAYTDNVEVKVWTTEKYAEQDLKKMDSDEHFIQKEAWTHIAEGIYDWQIDESYGHHGKKFLWDIERDYEKAI